MTVWIVVGSVLLFFAVLLCLPIAVSVDYEKQAMVKVFYLFFHFAVYPRPKKKEVEKEAAVSRKAETEKKSKLRQLLEREGVGGFLDLLKEISRIVRDAGKRLLTHMTVNRFSLRLWVGGEDAGQAAIQYGAACAAVYPAVSFFVGEVRCTRYEVEVFPNFQNKESGVQFHFQAHIKAFFALLLLLHAGIQTIKIILQKKKFGPERKWKQKNPVN